MTQVNDLLHDFLDETSEALEPLERFLIQLESKPDDQGLINSIFRPIHSLKGSASFFNLVKTQKICHQYETILSLLRSKKIEATNEIIAVLLEGLDYVRGTIRDVKESGTEVIDQKVYSEILDKLNKIDKAPVYIAPEIIDGILKKVDKLRGYIAEEDITAIEEVSTYINQYREVIKTKKPLPDSLAEMKAVLSTDEKLDLETSNIILDCLKKLKFIASDTKTLHILTTTIEEATLFINSVGPDALLKEIFIDIVDRLESAGKWTTSPDDMKPVEQASEILHDAKKKQTPQISNEKKPVEKTMRISENRLDLFLSYVGELVVIEEIFRNSLKDISRLTGEECIGGLRRGLESFEELSEKLRTSILEIRKIPLKTLLQKVPRIIHDVAKETNKEVEVSIQGEEIMIDKSYLELLDAPLTHMARNSVDHGIESPNERKSAGKSPTGTVSISVNEKRDMLELILTDDGKGINFDKIAEKSLELGMIKSLNVPRDTLLDCMFKPGFSTAEEVTDISGRGVGMDVVKSNIEEAGGYFSIDTQKGKGTTFSISLPQKVHTRIIHGFIFEVNDQMYILPVSTIREIIEPNPTEIYSVQAKSEVIQIHEKVIPVIRLSQVLDKKCNSEARYLIVIEQSKKRYALYVNNLHGIRRVVIKEFDMLKHDTTLYEGAAVLGDGSTTLILNASEIIKRSTE